MGKSSGSAPAAPDPQKVIGAQSAADKAAFNYQTDASRYDTLGPDQSVTWDKTPSFDQKGYDNALSDWNTRNTQGVWVPATTGAPSSYNSGDGGGDTSWSTPTPAHWSGATTDGSAAPDKSAFTSYDWTQKTTLNPEQQKIHDLQQSADVSKSDLLGTLTDQLKNQFSKPVDYSGINGVVSNVATDPTNVGSYEARLAALDPTAYDKNAGDAVYNQQSRYYDESQASSQQALEARLAEQGFVPGTPGYQSAMNTFQDNQNQAKQQMRDAATTAGYNVGHTQFGDSTSALNAAISAALQGNNQKFSQGQSNAALNNSSRSQQIAELLQQRAQPLNELNALQTGTQVGGNTGGGTGTGGSSGGTVGQFQAPDVMGAYNNQYKDVLAKYNAGVQSDNSDTQTAGAVISAIAMAFSDERLKSNFEHTGETDAGIPTYEYDIFDQRSKGVMAQDLLEHGQADAVHIDPYSGYYQVDYSKVR